MAKRLPYPTPSSVAVSAVMRGNRRRDTRPELALRRAVHSRGFRFRVDYAIELPTMRVRPDIVFTRSRVAVFVDGCFFHCCPEHGNQPRKNVEYWAPKLSRNVARDRRVDAALQRAGWSVVRAWEHEPIEDATTRVAAEVQRRRDEHGQPFSTSATSAAPPV